MIRSILPGGRGRLVALGLLAAATMDARRWIVRPWQWTLGNQAVLVFACALGLALAPSPGPVVAFVAAFVIALFLISKLPRQGARPVDVATLLAILLLGAAILLPAMHQVGARTLGKQFLPFAVPARYVSMLLGPR
jgi:hypothetical protein